MSRSRMLLLRAHLTLVLVCTSEPLAMSRHWFLHIPVAVVIFITYTSESDTSFSNASESDASVSNANNDIKWRGCSSWSVRRMTGRIGRHIGRLNVDTVFHSKPSGSSKSMLNNLYRFVPSIREQLQC